MAFIDATFGDFCTGQSLSGTSDQNSTNVFNKGSAVKAFAGVGTGKVRVSVSAVGGTNPTFRARVVAGDAADFSGTNEILADSGVTKVLGASDLPYLLELTPSEQKGAYQYYGVIFTQSGTSPTATVSAQYVQASQSNLVK